MKMRALEVIAESPFSVVSKLPDSEGGNYGWNMYKWLFDCHSFWHNVGLILPSALFVLYLAFQARKSFVKLSSGRSYIIIAYYGFLWLVSLLNLAWCSLQVWECSLGREVQWNILSLFTTSGMLFLEVSLIAFLLQGNYWSGREALTRTFVVSGFIVGLDILHKAIYVFGFAIPLFIDNGEDTHRVKWGLWVFHKLMLTAVYGVILFMYNSKWREKLPARPAFYNYTTIMFCLNTFALFACVLTVHGVGFGFWSYNVTLLCYHALYLPLLYITFLADFFQFIARPTPFEEEYLHLDNVYYSEMKDAGFFDADWE